MSTGGSWNLSIGEGSVMAVDKPLLPLVYLLYLQIQFQTQRGSLATFDYLLQTQVF